MAGSGSGVAPVINENRCEHSNPQGCRHCWAKANGYVDKEALAASEAAALRLASEDCRNRAKELEEGAMVYPDGDPFAHRRESSRLELLQLAKRIDALITPARAAALEKLVGEAEAREFKYGIRVATLAITDQSIQHEALPEFRAALEKVILKARLKEAEWWYRLAVEDGGVSDDSVLPENKRLANLRAKVSQ